MNAHRQKAYVNFIDTHTHFTQTLMTPTNAFDNKVAVVSGGTQGLGAAIATLLAERGLKGLITCGRNTANGQAVARRLQTDYGCQTKFVTADLSNVDDCRSVIAAADDAFGRIDVLVNVAAKTDRGTILDTDQGLFDSMIATNLRAPFFLIQDAVKIMLREQIEGSIVNIGSTSGVGGQPFIAAYCSSKGALETLTRNTAFALMRNRIRVNQVNPGWMSTEGEDSIQRSYHNAPDNWLEVAGQKQAFGRLVDPIEVARAVAYLASSESGLMTGQIINMDQYVVGGFESVPQPTNKM